MDSASGERIEGDLICVCCGYNLRTLAEAGWCPECGRPVADSLRFGTSAPSRAVRYVTLCLVAVSLTTLGLTLLAWYFFHPQGPSRASPQWVVYWVIQGRLLAIIWATVALNVVAFVCNSFLQTRLWVWLTLLTSLVAALLGSI